ncbi:sulfite exporter TauE/SafE family protein 5-like [Syzygium oleosum]|uniref:sulfite exporter TauE/SafE family protein 5-like n=1 Tax=Syzygium oleosum TaxID=219896 RepID=UPI0024BBD114|nr:sulfite exporter TauE/SafE family protein 5-like [Syzygium oleosum]
MNSAFLLSALFFFFFTILSVSHAQGGGPISSITRSHDLSSQTHQWRHTQMTKPQETHVKFKSFPPPMVQAGVLCFVAAAVSSAGGIGGGGLFIPILAIVAGLELKTASSFSAFMVTGGSIANVICNLIIKSPKFGGKCLIDYDIALLSEPCMLLGVSIGVICNVVFPEWLITILFTVFLAWSTFKTCKNGVSYWKLESEEAREIVHLEKGSVREGGFDGSEEAKIAKKPLLGVEPKCQEKFPWMKLGVLVLVWFSFFLVYVLRGNRNGQSIITIEPCGPGYWILSSVQIPLAGVFTSWILFRKESIQHQVSSQQDIDDPNREGPTNRLIFPVMALLAGLLGGIFGIGGGMLISPLLLQVGIAPEITAATCSFMVFFSSTMSALQYILLGMEHTDIALIFSFICFVASLLGIIVVQRAIREYGRASLIVFSVSIVMALSTVLITGFGAVEIWNDYISGKYMGFKPPCRRL